MTIICGDCQTKNDDDAIFCRSPSCGALLEWSGTDAWPEVSSTKEGASPKAQATTAELAPPREPGREYEPPEHSDEDEPRQQLPPTVGQLVCSSCATGNWPHVLFCRRCGAVLQGSAVTVPPSRLPLLASILFVGWLVAIVVGLGAWLAFRPRGIVGTLVLVALVLALSGLGVLVLRFKRSHRIDNDPLPARERKRPRNPFLGKGRMERLSASLKVLAVVLGVAAICIGGLWAWNSAIRPQMESWYASSREALFPRFRPVAPALIVYTVPNTCAAQFKARPGPRKKVTPASRAVPNQVTVKPPLKTPAPKGCFPVKSQNSIAEAFDNDLSTYWLSPTSRDKNDRIVLRFDPQTDIAAFTIYAGDPTGAQVVPEVIGMTFYGPAEKFFYPPPVSYPPPKPTKNRDGTLKSAKERTYWPIISVQEWTLVDTAAQQRFSTGELTDIARVVITIRGTHPNADRKATQAVTEIEFFDKH